MNDEIEIGVTEGVADPQTEQAVEQEAEQEVEQAVEQPAEQPDEQPAEQPDEQEIPNDVWATARRRAEAQARERMDREVADRFAGYTNPKTGAPITNAREYWEALDAQREIEHQQALRQATEGLSREQAAALRAAMQNDPEKTRMQAQLEQMQRTVAEEKARAAFEADLSQVMKLDPSVKGAQDLTLMEGYDQLVDMVQHGISMVDAYKAINYQKMVAASKQAGRQAAINAVKGKSHLAAHDGENAAGNMKPIPGNMLNAMKEQFPTKSVEELTKLYNQTL